MCRRITLALLGMLLMSAAPAFGQDNPGGPGPGGGPGGPPGGPPDFAQMRQRMEERLKERLGATDDQWPALRAKIEAVQQLQRELHPRPPFGPGGPRGNGGPGNRGGPNGNVRGGPGGPNSDARGGPDGPGPGGGPPDDPANMGPGGPGGPTANSTLLKAVDELNKLLRTEDAKPDDIKAAIAKLRDERANVKTELTKAQTDLQSVVSTRQEAILLTMGILE
ncbi:MAG: hypothetical protein ABSB42_20930 [Tepidisphaeraceae bacterium]